MIEIAPYPFPSGARRVLLFGGTFDPPHRGHIIPSIAAREAIGADLLVFIPAARSPHKSASPTISDEARLRLLASAIRAETPTASASTPFAAISTLELERGRTGRASYTIDTLESIVELFPDSFELRLLIGADQVLAFHKWREPERIIALAEPAVLLRPPLTSLEEFRQALANRMSSVELDHWLARVVPTPILDIDATSLRVALAEGRYEAQSVRSGLASEVLESIITEGLYRNRGGPDLRHGDDGAGAPPSPE